MSLFYFVDGVIKMERDDSKHREASNPCHFCIAIRWWWPGRRARIWGGGSWGLQLSVLLLLSSHDALHIPCSHCSCLAAMCHSHLPSSCITFISALALLVLNGVVDDLLRHRWIMGIHWIIWTRYFVGLSFILLGVLWVRKEDLWCESLF